MCLDREVKKIFWVDDCLKEREREKKDSQKEKIQAGGSISAEELTTMNFEYRIIWTVSRTGV